MITNKLCLSFSPHEIIGLKITINTGFTPCRRLQHLESTKTTPLDNNVEQLQRMTSLFVTLVTGQTLVLKAITKY